MSILNGTSFLRRFKESTLYRKVTGNHHLSRKRRPWTTRLAITAFLMLVAAAIAYAVDSAGSTGGILNLGTASPVSVPKTPQLAPFPTQPPPRVPPVVAMDVVGPGELWIVDGYGMFFSSDWGTTWRYTDPPSLGDPIADYTSVSFINSEDGWLIAATPKGAGVDHTVNGGKSWTSALLPSVALAGRISNSLSFANPNDGFIAIGPYSPSGDGSSVILASTNGGSKWSVVDGQAPVSQIRFESSTIGWGLNPQGTGLYMTQDGGTSWQEVSLPSRSGASDGSGALWESLTLPMFFGKTGVLLAQPVSGNALVEITNNDGKTWKSLPTPFQVQPTVTPGKIGPICQTCVSVGAEPFSVLNSTTFVYWGGGTLYRTIDGGESWTSINPSPTFSPIGHVGMEGVLGPLQFSSEKNGWAITRSDSLLLTRDGGVHFARVTSPCHPFPAQSCSSMGLKPSS